VIFNTCFSSIICCRGKFYFKDFFNCHFELFGENYENYHYRTDVSMIINVFKIIRYICMNFNSLGHKFKLKFEIS
jgi:hypothetical protein